MMNIGALGWALAVPGGDATAYVEIGDKVIEFDEGSGYHDHVSSSRPSQRFNL